MENLLKKIYDGKIFTKKYDTDKEWSKNKESLYGEITQEGLEHIVLTLKELNIFKNISFCDIGCGNGRAVLHLGLYDEVIKSKGIDLFESKVDFANTLLNEIEYPNTSKINIEHGDALEKEDYYDCNTFLFNNVAWAHETNIALLDKIKKGSYIITTTSIKDSVKISIIKKFKVLYSWNKKGPGPCWIYEKI